MGKKVTIQDIADALGLSRNTVSKAINNSEGLAENTKQLILDKAVEMGYKQFSYVMAMAEVNRSRTVADEIPQSGEIALFTTSQKNRGSHFSSLMMDKFQQEITQLGFLLVTYSISKDALHTSVLPPTFSKERTRAVICIGIFDKQYADLVCSIGLPVLFVDAPCWPSGRSVNGDLLLMDNTTEISQFIHDKAALGIKRFGFIGDYRHCQSFYERYAAFRQSLIREGLEYDEKFVISPSDRDLGAMRDMLHDLDEYPDCFICANDFNAIDAMMILRLKDSDLLKQVRFLGFDDSHESRIFTPALSTVHIHTQSLAFTAVALLMTRMQYPTMEYRTVHVATDLILRDSTEF
ncbi:MAG: LacI family DNA-binding transcriptional regulator [Erysipelotrichaceae bacterium]|nr:LacI family DNA-binding transcriptional regulator [Erysipelotrichaceae bacterium]